MKWLLGAFLLTSLLAPIRQTIPQPLYLPIILRPVNAPTTTATATTTSTPSVTPTTTVTSTSTPTATATPTLVPTPGGVGDCACTGDLYNCPDFPNQGAAQACLEHCLNETGQDIHRLDQDNDGTACESLPPLWNYWTDEPVS